MPRRDAQVHKTISRLLRGSNKPPPIWYGAMLAYPPTSPPPLKLQNQKRRAFDLSPNVTPSQLLDKRPVNIVYPEDRLRQQFFKDHPYEAFRAKNLVESREVGEEAINGPEWQRLVQRGRNPTPEDCIQYSLNLHQTMHMPLSDAYRSAVHQYRALRAEHAIMRSFACAEADAYGAEFSSYEFDRLHRMEEAELEKWRLAQQGEKERLARNKKWTATPNIPPAEWSAGDIYMQRLRQGGGPRLRSEIVYPESGINSAETTQTQVVDTFLADGSRLRTEDDEDILYDRRGHRNDIHAPTF
ncbi:hypothetical protein DACRYDRAFT_81744 [Dacryopinax primogenitus]|uniref:Small ribosomal subunit protein mS23 n=1 Tax=Dacryopinax primogenitus (strain DJM 731) TaxID=1858805 RepID=M5G8I6_DACPD|nr:uncharacterized protein DACRYDRAFT_81744 [Dacryopinax primogenitus]EJU00078.1 hypothetical protein DACRYDRAFT_81744 [Dacryopinax primogenitus]